MASTFYDLAPKDIIENLKWRIRCRERALVDERFRNALIQACETDVLFFFAFALWVHEPRAKIKMRPFIPWKHQEAVILAMDDAITEAMEKEHPVSVTVKKSRAQGGTYTYLGVQIRRALTEKGFSSGLVTRNEKMMDSKDPSAVMNKLSMMLDKLPLWMLDGYDRNITDHTIRIPETNSVWIGFSATADVARGGRTTLFAFDEVGSEEFISGGIDYKIMSSVAHVTNCCAKGSMVVTDRGLVAIEDVNLTDRVWDGTTWIHHSGCVYQGRRDVISTYGVGLTPDHKVFTVEGWRDASEGFDRAEIRLPDGYREEWINSTQCCKMEMPVRMRQGRGRDSWGFEIWEHEELRVSPQGDVGKAVLQARKVSDSRVCLVEEYGVTMHRSSPRSVPSLRRERGYCLRSMDGFRGVSCGYGLEAGRLGVGQDRQQQGLLSWELSMGDATGELQQQEEQSLYGNVSRRDDRCGDFKRSWCDYGSDPRSHQEGCSRGRFTEATIGPGRIAVYDLLNCGPKRAFTVIDDDGRPLLVHNCVFLCSTFGADTGVFYESAMDPDNPRVFPLDWKDNPEHAALAYVKQDGVVKAVNPEEQDAVDNYIATHERELRAIERKGHKIEGKIRSPWYDSHCLIPGATPRYIARELDMDARGSAGKVFAADLLDRMKRENAKKPVWRGVPVFDNETLELKGLIPREDGPLSLWFKPGIDNSPPLGPFTIACDIASGGVGAYSSNSVASGIDNRTGEQVLEYTIKGLEPRPFARMVVGLCLWMRKALLGWEDSGVSGGFAKEVVEVCYYGNVFYRDVMQLGSQKKSRKAGFPCRDADKADMFEQFALAMEQKRYIPRSEEMIVECGEYEWDGAKIIHAPTKNKGATEKNHGDRAISAAGAWLVFATDNADTKVDSDIETGQNPEYGSFLWRERQERKFNSSESPSYGIRDVLRK